MIWLMPVGIIGFLFWYKFVRPLNHFPKLGVKQLKPWPIIGNQWTLFVKKMSFPEFIEWAYHAFPHDRYFGIYQFTFPTLVIKDPELIKQITVKDFDHFSDHKTVIEPDIDPLWAGNLVALTGQRWKEMRATLSGSFTSSKMKNMFGLMDEAAENFTKYFLNQNQEVVEVELKETFTKYTNDVIATTAFGIKVDSLDNPDNIFFLMGKKSTDFSKKRLRFLAFLLFPKLFKWLKIGLFDAEVGDFFRNTIKETIQVREENGIVRQDMINLLLEARKGIKHEDTDAIETGFATVKESTDISKFKQARKLTNDDITSQALIFFIAGFDTISTALSFGSYELALNKDVQDKLRLEIVETHAATNGKLTYESLLKMKYLDMVVSEILRKWPPAVVTDRIATKPYTILPVTPDEKPVELKVGDIIWLPMQGLHRDPDFFPNPEKFDPERFSDENKGSIRPYTYIPFGSGPRNCIGSRFALLEAKALLYNLLLHFEIVPIKRTPIPLKLNRKGFNHTAEDGFWLGLKRVTT